MTFKVHLLIFMLLLTLSISCTVSNSHGQVIITTDDPEAMPQVYNPGNVDTEKPNLLIGGISQRSPDPAENDPAYRTFAINNQAYYLPTYYPGRATVEPTNLQYDLDSNVLDDSIEVDKAAQSIETYRNGLKSDALNGGKEYGTIFSYSGGTTSVVTALAEGKIKADTLYLISPMCGGLEQAANLFGGAGLDPNFDWEGEFEQKLQKILSKGTKVVVFQSSDDTPPLGENYQYKIPEEISTMSSWLNEIEVHNVDLEKSGIDGHKEMFFSFAMKYIRNGEYSAKIDLSTYLKLGTPWLSPPSDMLSGEANKGPSVSSGTDGSPSVVGTWKVFIEMPALLPGSSPFTIYNIMTFNPDGTFSIPEQSYSESGSDWHVDAQTGTWTQTGNSVSWTSSSGVTYAGTISSNGMSGMADGISWSAQKIGGAQGSSVGLLLDEDLNGADGW